MSYPIFQRAIEEVTGEELTPELKFHKTRRWRFDYAIERLKIAIEVEGGVWSRGRHTRPSGFVKDLEKYNTATSLGWLVLRFDKNRLMNVKTFNLIKNTIKQRE